MEKKMFFLASGLLSCFFAMSNVALAAQEVSSPKAAAHSFYLDSLNKERNVSKITEELAKLTENYSFFVPKGTGIKVRQGPGVDHKAYTQRLNGAEAWQGNTKSDAWLGGIVHNVVLPGDDKCSGWQEVIYVSRLWEEVDLIKASADTPAYVCKDFIKTGPIDEKNLFRFKLYQFGVRSLQSWGAQYNLLSGPITVSGALSLMNNKGESVYTLKEGDKVAFGNWEQWTIKGLQQKSIPVYLFVNDNDAVNVGLVFWKDAESFPVEDAASKENLQKYFTKK